MPLNFGADDYVWVKLAYATCLMKLGQYTHAVTKFESTKRQIEAEIVYQRPTIFIEACISLGYCLLDRLQQEGFTLNDLVGATPDDGSTLYTQLTEALDNFESALCLIERLNTEGWDEVINHRSFETGQYGKFDSENLRGQICMNIALIRAHLSHTEQAIVMLEKSCEISRTIVRDKPAPAELEHLRDLLILLAN